MGLLQKLKSALGLDGAQSPEPGTAAPRDVDVTVEREPSSESEDAVKGTETAATETGTSDEPDLEGTTGEPSHDEAPIEEAEPPVESTGAGATETETEEADVEPASDSTAGAADVPADPVTEITGIGAAYGARLENAGVETVADLAEADPDELAASTDIAAGRIEGWIDAAEEY